MILRTNIHRPLFILLLIIYVLSSVKIHTCTGACDPLDLASLTSFNLSLSSLRALDWSPSIDCCDWEGITCDDNTGKVTGLTLQSKGLVGTISPSIINLTTLVQLKLTDNWLTGPLPDNLFPSLNHLQIIDLSRNRLSGELVSLNQIPPTVKIFNLSNNQFRGPIRSAPLQTGLNLEAFDVHNNSFSGTIPAVICTLFPLILQLDFSNNDFNGAIPRGFSNCSNLQSLRAGFSNLSDVIPEDIYQLSLLEELYLPGNRLTGPIDEKILNLTSLKALALFGNDLHGPIPTEIGKLSRLEELELHINRLTGTIPTSLRNCSNLTLLDLRVNHLEGQLSSFDFSNFLLLKTVDLGNNFFHGVLPKSLFECKTLTALRLATNNLSGEILPEIASLPLLSFFSVSNNSLTNLTSAIRILSGCPKLSALMLAMNFYNEQFPENITGFQNIQILGFGACNLTGQIPVWIRKLNTLKVIDLSYNKFTGFVPGWFGSLPNLFYLDLSFNLLTGLFPVEFIKLPLLSTQMNSKANSSYLELPIFAKPDNASNLQYNQLSNLPRAIYLGNNSFNGSIPSEIGQLRYIIALDLSNNDFTGEIPDTISHLTNLEKLELSGNNLTGEIPASLQNLNFLSSFSVADNDLEGPVPTGGQFGTFPNTSFEGNPKLCGQILQRSCNGNKSGNADENSPERKNNSSRTRKKTIILTLVISSAIFTLVLLLYLFFSKKRILWKGGEKNLESMSFNSSGVFPEFPKETSVVVLFTNSKGKKILDLTVADILKATDNFNQANIIGCGGFGLVFKATLSDGTNLAIKKLSGDMGLMEREFKAEVEALSMAQHKNLVTLQGYCLHDGYRLLIYSYMENGSLDYWLHERPDGPSNLDWKVRLKILQGTSRGVAYMHQTCDPHIIHRDLKSSNILLDKEFEAHVADFGLARMILPYHTHVTTELVGTLGYIPPEYSQSWMATLRGDMYSFGVVMLELLSGKRPMEMFKPKVSRELVVWARQMRGEGREEEIYDDVLRGKGFEEEMARVLDVACMCVSQNPLDRPTIKDVDDWLENVGSNVHTIL